MDVDSAFVASDDDTWEDRTYWMASACPCREQCSASSWGRVLKYSYLNDEVVRGHIQEHLTGSSLHNLSKEDAEHHAALAVVEVFTETAEERRAYRQSSVRKRSPQTRESPKASRVMTNAWPKPSACRARSSASKESCRHCEVVRWTTILALVLRQLCAIGQRWLERQRAQRATAADRQR